MNTNAHKASLLIGALVTSGAGLATIHVAVVHHDGPLVLDESVYVGLMLVSLAALLLVHLYHHLILERISA